MSTPQEPQTLLTSAGETNLRTLLTTLSPTLHPETYIYLTTTQPLSSLPLSTLQPTLLFTEPEGLTIITTRERARASNFPDHDGVYPCRMISLQVHSSLEAVGLMATVSGRLAEKGISVNVVSGFWHDHVFVPVGREGEAMGVLEGIMRGG